MTYCFQQNPLHRWLLEQVEGRINLFSPPLFIAKVEFVGLLNLQAKVLSVSDLAIGARTLTVVVPILRTKLSLPQYIHLRIQSLIAQSSI